MSNRMSLKATEEIDGPIPKATEETDGPVSLKACQNLERRSFTCQTDRRSFTCQRCHLFPCRCR